MRVKSDADPALDLKSNPDPEYKMLGIRNTVHNKYDMK